MEDKNLDLMNDIMRGVAQSGEWHDILAHDPRITAADDRYSAALEKAREWLPKTLYMELSDAHTDEITDAGEAGILFGIRVADVIRDATSRPKYVMNRREDNDPQYHLEDIVCRLGGILRDLQREIDAAEGNAAKRVPV